VQVKNQVNRESVIINPATRCRISSSFEKVLAAIARNPESFDYRRIEGDEAIQKKRLLRGVYTELVKVQ